MVAIPHQALLAIATTRSGVSTVWNAADKNANITLSNASLTGTCGAAAQSGVRGTVSHAGSGKYYLEFTALANGGSGNFFVGFAKAAFGLSSTNAGDSNVIAYSGGGVGFFGVLGGFNNTGLPDPQGNTICFAIDFTNGQVWVRVNNGLWNGSGTANPATNVGGFGFAGASILFPCLALGAVGAAGTLNGGNSGTAFSFSVPAGFNNWDS